MRKEPATRLLHLARLFAAEPAGIGIEEIASRFGVSRRTAERMSDASPKYFRNLRRSRANGRTWCCALCQKLPTKSLPSSSPKPDDHARANVKPSDYDVLTRYNILLSRPTMRTGGSDPLIAINCKPELPVEVADYVRDSLAHNTRRAYLSDLAHFKSWGGDIPATDIMVASYLAAYAKSLSTTTLGRRLVSISKAHKAQGACSPIVSELVKATLRGIKRKEGRASRQAQPLLKEELFAVLDAMGNSLKDARDKALLSIGFAGGFRRSELVGLDVADIRRDQHGLIIHLRRSKTDQYGVGRKIGIPVGATRCCPVAALEAWLARSGIAEGAIFRLVDRHSKMTNERLSGEAVSLVLKHRLKATGVEPYGYSGHSLRAGFATSAAAAGVPLWLIRRTTGHASQAMLSRYIRDGELFTNSAAGALL